MTSILQMIVLLLVILLVTFYLVLPKKEGFLNLSGVTSSSLYKDASGDVDANFNAMQTTLADKGSLLHMRRCYQFPEYTLEQLRNALNTYTGTMGMYSMDFDMITCKFDDVESRIVCELQKFKDKICGVKGKIQCGASRNTVAWNANNGCKSVTPVVTGVQQTKTNPECLKTIQGPVYALVFQAPYYRTKDSTTNEERTLALQFQTLDTMLMPYNGMQKSEDDSTTPIYVYVQLWFPRYNNNGTYMPQVNFMDQYILPELDRKFFSKEMQCFIKTVGKYDMVGGCASTTTPYEAKCLGPKTAVNYEKNDEKSTLSTYGVLYQVNQSYALFNDMFTPKIATFTTPLSNLPEVYFHKGSFTSVDAAANACQETGGVIASREDAYDAYSYGHNVCDKGFVEDGYVANSSQGTLASCSTAKGFTLNSFQNQTNVGAFCYGLRPNTNTKVSAWDTLGYTSRKNWLDANKPQQKCGTFSEEKYFAKYPDAKASNMSGIQHWLTQGIAKGYSGMIKESDATGSFDSTMYGNLYNGQLKNKTPLQHLKEFGIGEGNRVCLK